MSDTNKVVYKTFLHCSKCNKRLIERLQNGLFKFIFGAGKTREGEYLPPPVQMKVHGSVQMKCTRRTCEQINTFQYFPHIKSFESQSGNPETKYSDNYKQNKKEV